MIQKRSSFPELSHLDESDLENCIFVTISGIMGFVCEVPLIDLEDKSLETSIASLENLLKAIPQGYTLRVKHTSEPGDTLTLSSFRTSALNQIGYFKKSVLISIEKDMSPSYDLRFLFSRKNSLKAQLEGFREKLPRNELKALGAKALSPEEIRQLFRLPEAEVHVATSHLDYGTHVTGVIRLWKQGSYPISESSFSSFLELIPQPFEVVVTLKKEDKRKTDFKLRSRLSQQSVDTDPVSQEKFQETHKALQNSFLRGVHFYEVELIFLLVRREERQLREDLELAISSLRPLGEVMIETKGAVPSYIASLVGSKQHFTFVESDEVASLYLPLFTNGEFDQKINDSRIAERALLLHRADGSIHAFDLFSKQFLAFNALITGKTGSGKSVFANLLSSSLFHDPNVMMIKVDVGGSYRRECEIYGGDEVHFSLDQPSGVNPFDIFSDVKNSNESISILTEFLCTLIREESESGVSKSIQGQVEAHLKAYASFLQEHHTPSIDHFIECSPAFPRLNLLSRWAQGGVFENALKQKLLKKRKETNRYRYYNFENIQSASNRDFSEGVMAAVITAINLEMLRLSQPKSELYGKRIVLVCDETKFFVERNAKFFLLTTANFRKFGHGVILMAQNIKNFELSVDGAEKDMGIILNSPIRVFYPSEIDADYLMAQFHLSEAQINAIVRAPHRGADYREAVLQDDRGTRIIRVYLTSNEYWRVSTTRSDIDKYNELKKACPSLKVEELIQCLTLQ